jgi:hypothetical protein
MRLHETAFLPEREEGKRRTCEGNVFTFFFFFVFTFISIPCLRENSSGRAASEYRKESRSSFSLSQIRHLTFLPASVFDVCACVRE